MQDATTVLGDLTGDIWNFWRAWRVRRAVVGEIAPLIAGSRSRLGTIPAIAWRDPYTIGLLAMAITLTAWRVGRGRLRAGLLASVQLDVWGELTRVLDDEIGERILLLSAARDEAFMAGCRDAARIFAVIPEARLPSLPWRPGTDHLPEFDPLTAPISRTTAAMHAEWQACFDAHISATLSN